MICKASQLRTTSTHSPPDPYLVKEENIYLLQQTDFFFRWFRRDREFGSSSDVGIRSTWSKGIQFNKLITSLWRVINCIIIIIIIIYMKDNVVALKFLVCCFCCVFTFVDFLFHLKIFICYLTIWILKYTCWQTQYWHQLQINTLLSDLVSYKSSITQLAGAVEYSNCISTERVRLPLTSTLDMTLKNLMMRFQ